jgi:hypothetical protein
MFISICGHFTDSPLAINESVIQTKLCRDFGHPREEIRAEDYAEAE